VLAVAHRRGNEVLTLREAALLGADVIEGDVHLHRGQLEVRHQKSMGPLPWFWEKWKVYPPHLPRPSLAELLEGRPSGATLMLDLKGVGRVGSKTRAAVAEHPPHDPFLVCARWWPSLRHFHDLQAARVVLSARGPVALSRLRRRLRAGHAPYGVSVHLSVLTPALVREIQGYGVLVLSWPVDDRPSLERARELGIDGAITKDLEIVKELVAERRALSPD
jgi:glycerophosphoryl diester phosphodiesterase